MSMSRMKSIRRSAVPVILSLIALSAYPGCSTDESVSVSRESSVVTKADWMEELPSAMSDEVCAQESMFRKCFSVSDQDCDRHARILTVNCEQRYHAEIPSRLRSTDTARWGQKLGKCIGGVMLETLSYQQKPSDSAECQLALRGM